MLSSSLPYIELDKMKLNLVLGYILKCGQTVFLKIFLNHSDILMLKINLKILF